MNSAQQYSYPLKQKRVQEKKKKKGKMQNAKRAFHPDPNPHLM